MRTSGFIGLGPLEENDTTLGAMASFHVSPTRILALGSVSRLRIIQLGNCRNFLNKQLMISVSDLIKITAENIFTLLI